MVFWKKKSSPSQDQDQVPSAVKAAGPHEHPHQASAGTPPAQESNPPQSNSQGQREEQGGTSRVKNILAIASGKGGVGKSTVTTNLALALKTRGFKVGLLDADIYGPSQPSLMGSSQERAKGSGGNIIPIEKWGIKFVSMGVLLESDGPVVWRAPMAMKLLQQFLKNVLWGELDFLLIDLPPGTGDVQITLAQQAHLTGAIIVTTPQAVAVQIARKGLMMFEQVNVPILGIIENMTGFSCPHCQTTTPIFHEGGGKMLAQESNTVYLGGIPLDPIIMVSGDEGVPLLEKNPQSGPSKVFLEMADRTVKRLREIAETPDYVQPLDFALTPKGELFIEWGPEHRGFHTPYSLRLNCPCANCVDEMSGKKLVQPQNIPLDIKATSLQRIGRYGVSIRFTDGHSTGIYKFSVLKDMCECPKCLTEGLPGATSNANSFNV